MLPINQSINQSNFCSANMPGEARLSCATAKSAFNSKIEETVPYCRMGALQSISSRERRLSKTCPKAWGVKERSHPFNKLTHVRHKGGGKLMPTIMFSKQKTDAHALRQINLIHTACTCNVFRLKCSPLSYWTNTTSVSGAWRSVNKKCWLKNQEISQCRSRRLV